MPSIQKYRLVSITTVFMAKFVISAFADEADKNLAGQIEALKKAGIGCIELRGVNGKNVKDLTVEEAKEVRAQLNNEGIRVSSMGSPFGKIGVNDDFEPHFAEFKHALELCKVLGCEYMRMFSFFYPKDEDPAKYRDVVIERLTRMLDAAEEAGILLCHENEKGIYGDVASRCLEIHKAVPEIKCVFDPANYVQAAQNTLEAWEMLEPYVFYGHIKDSLADGSIVPPGKGEGHIPEYLPKFKAKGCEVLTLEPHLAVFSALADIEQKGDESKIGLYKFTTAREAFDFAVNSLKDIIKTI